MENQRKNVFENLLKNDQKMLQNLFNKQNVIDAVGSAVKAKPGNDRVKVLALLASHCLVMAPMIDTIFDLR